MALFILEILFTHEHESLWSSFCSLLDPTSMDIFYLTEQKMKSPTLRCFFYNFQYPSESLKDVVACIQSCCLDASSHLVVREYYKHSCVLQRKFQRIHQGKFLPQDTLYEEGTQSTSFIDNTHHCSRGTSGMNAKRKLSVNQMTDD